MIGQCIVFESNGFLHNDNDSITFLHQIANNCAADKGIPTDAIFNYCIISHDFKINISQDFDDLQSDARK